MENGKPNYYAVIPAEIRYNNKLTANAKLLYGEITALCVSEGFCWATNNYFANLYKVSAKTVQNWLNDLKASGVIRIIYSSISGGKDLTKRKIYIVPSNSNSFHAPTKKTSHGVGNKGVMRGEKNFAHNNKTNTTNSITTNNHKESLINSISSISRENNYKPSLEEFAEYCLEKSLYFDYEEFYSVNELRYHWAKPWKESISMWCTTPHTMPEYYIVQDIYKFIFNHNSNSPWLMKHEEYAFLKNQLIFKKVEEN